MIGEEEVERSQKVENLLLYEERGEVEEIPIKAKGSLTTWPKKITISLTWLQKASIIFP